MRRLVGGSALAVALGAMGVLGLLRVVGAQEPPAPAPLEGAIVDEAGWWNRLYPRLELPIGQPPPPPVPGVPAGSLVVGANVGEPSAVTAIAIDPESLPGATVTGFTMTLREIDDPGANVNTAFAAIAACPITSFWIGGENLVWETQPPHDCGLAKVQGVRADDGTWSFDLTAIGQLWSDDTIAPNGVLLMEDAEPPTSFRAVFGGLASQAIGVIYTAEGGEEPTDPFGTPGGSFGGSPPAPPTGGSGLGGGGGGSRPTGGGTPAAPVVTTAPVVPTTAPAEEVATDVPDVRIGDLRSPLGSLPWATIPLILSVILIALAAMIALGPLGEPTSARSGRGVTRALARKELS